MTTITREQQKQILIDTANHVISRDNTSPYSENLRELARIALASLEAEPIGAFHIADQQVGGTSDYIKDGEWPIDNGVIEVYAAPPAPIVPEEIEPDSNNTYDYVDGWNACRAAMLQGAEPVSQTYELPELIEGMEVSIDVSTCDADAGNRYFGTVTEVSELDTAKNGYILLVQDAKPNFKTAGNSPAIPDDWVMVPKEPTQAMIKAWLSEVANWRGHVAGYKAALAAAPQHEVK
ncbi:hypothetical protein LD86_21070 [Salmonella enterica subsp. enterica]|nr:hypothetical protein [Salmonella enterica subsp. enterica]ECC2069246.1 hypothetical protein [Salmonella enterica]ECG6536191.1 hypothetical protein [Salmonella enterica subsp. enterica serovar Frintrop]EKY4937273.1 hypothetical protein [Salmonella enterica]